MCRNTQKAKLTPGGLAVDCVEIGAAKIIVTARPSTRVGTCPECGAVSGQIHSRYKRRLIDLPAHGRIVEINVETRRFQPAGDAYLSSGSVTLSRCRGLAELHGWTA
jgi:transposase